MKKIFYTMIALSYHVCITFGQNLPSGINTPLPATVPLVTLPSGYSAPELNFTRTYFPQTKTTDPSFSSLSVSIYASVKAITTYTNGWGTPIETISRGDHDLVTPYDNRPYHTQTNFLPYAAFPGSRFQATPFSDQRSYFESLYPSENGMSYSQSITSYEHVVPTVHSYQAGSSFVGNHNGTVVTSTINVGTEGIIIYPVPPGTAPAAYPAGQLTIKTTTTPNNGKTMEYFDKNGREICKQVVNTDVGTPQLLTTYYVYDDVNKLIQVITPAASSLLAFDPTTVVSDLMYTNVYNLYGSPVVQNIPGRTGADFTVYDLKNRAVLYQSPLLQSLGKYKFNIYDSRDRLILSGLFTDANTYDYWQVQLNTVTAPASGTLLYYLINGVTGSAYPTTITGCEIEQVNFYDNYTVPRTYDHSYDASFTPRIFSDIPAPYMVTHGLQTASLARVRNAGMDASSDLWVCSVYFYDQKGHMIQVQTLNPANARNYTTCLSGASGSPWDVLTTQYSITGQKITEVLFSNDLLTTDKPSTKIVNNYYYDMDNGGRFLSAMQSIDDGTGVPIVATTQYDDLNRVVKKSLGGVEIQNYDYSIRGQLTGINRDYANNQCGPGSTASTFGCIIDYDYGFTQPRYDGSISGIFWRGASRTTPLRAYGYEYDPAGQLIGAEFRQYCYPFTDRVSCDPPDPAYAGWNKNHTDFTVSNIRYDYNGNLMSMNQRGTAATGPVDMDRLSYLYKPHSNELLSVTDGVTTDFHLGDFLDVVPNCGPPSLPVGRPAPGAGGGDDESSGTESSGSDYGGIDPPCYDYSYDPDGNLASDSNKHIANIVYNEMDQPLTVTYQNGSTINNVYTGAGTLVKKDIYTFGSGVEQIYRYCGPFVYSGNTSSPHYSLQYALHDEGRARFDATTGFFTYDYFVKDHLGNVRTVVTGFATNNPATIYSATMPTSGGTTYFASHEIAAAGTEDAVFTNIDAVRDNKPASIDSADAKAARLNGGDSTRIVGTAIMLKVMAGDSFIVSAQSYWASSDVTPVTDSASTVLNALISTLTNTQGNLNITDNTATQLVSDAFTPDNYALYNAMLDSITDPFVPRAYINYMLFDEHMNLLIDQSGAIQIGATANAWQNIGMPDGFRIGRSGYLVVNIMNTQNQDVSLDKLTIGLVSGPLIQEQHYYPFGLTINEGESGTIVKNNFKYQGKELQYEPTMAYNLYDFTARQYDPQIGRFWSIDPAGQFPSGYTGMGNNPANLIDPTGCTANNTSGPQDPTPWWFRASSGGGEQTGEGPQLNFAVNGFLVDENEFYMAVVINGQPISGTGEGNKAGNKSLIYTSDQTSQSSASTYDNSSNGNTYCGGFPVALTPSLIGSGIISTLDGAAILTGATAVAALAATLGVGYLGLYGMGSLGPNLEEAMQAQHPESTYVAPGLTAAGALGAQALTAAYEAHTTQPDPTNKNKNIYMQSTENLPEGPPDNWWKFVSVAVGVAGLSKEFFDENPTPAPIKPIPPKISTPFDSNLPGLQSPTYMQRGPNNW